MHIGEAPARATAVAIGFAVVALVLLTACLPSVLIGNRMPMSIHRDESGALSMRFPVCQGDRVTKVGVTAGPTENLLALRYGPAPKRQAAPSVETFVVDSESVAQGRLDVPWPMSETWPPGSVDGLAALGYVHAGTDLTSAGFYVSTLSPGGAGDWLVTGDRIEHKAEPVATSAADANAAVESFCKVS
jgi:hypothetical protein